MSWGRGAYGQNNRVDSVLADMSEKQRQREILRAQKEQAEKEMKSRYFQELIRANPRHAREIMQANPDAFAGVNLPQMAPSPRERVEGRYWEGLDKSYDPSKPMQIDPVAAGLFSPDLAGQKPWMDAAGQRYTYGNQQNLPAEVTQAQRVGDKLDLNADEKEKKAQTDRAYSNIDLPESQATVFKTKAETGKIGAEATKVREETTNVRMERDPNSPLSKGFQPQGQGAARTERDARITAAVDDLFNRTNGTTAGVGSILANVPGSPARNYRADLDTLKANIAFGELQAMREASKTGGALGQVAIREIELLESSLGALDQGQDPENLKKNLKKIRDSIARFRAAEGGATPGAQGGDPLGILGN